MQHPERLTILGGGPCGLAHGFYAARRGLPFVIHEARQTPGGNCRTFCVDGRFRYDSGAHRLHDKAPQERRQIGHLLAQDLRRVAIPSAICDRGKMLPFPISSAGLWRHLGTTEFVRSAGQVVRRKLERSEPDHHFEGMARQAYGERVADRFLLNYSEKLWGIPCSTLSPTVAGGRLAGLDLKQLLLQNLPGLIRGERHMEGAFYYPRLGIGMAMDALAVACGPNIVTGSRVTAIFHDGGRIEGIELNHAERLPTVGEVVCTLPLNEVVQMLVPAPPSPILELARSLRFRHLRLAALFVARDQVQDAATVYFPRRELPFTRVYEPKLRSPQMAPTGHTSLVGEFPCFEGDPTFDAADGVLTERLVEEMTRLDWLGPGELLGSQERLVRNAYPVLDLDSGPRVAALTQWLGRLGNLRLAGRNGLFAYSWIHDMMSQGRQTADELCQRRFRASASGHDVASARARLATGA